MWHRLGPGLVLGQGSIVASPGPGASLGAGVRFIVRPGAGIRVMLMVRVTVVATDRSYRQGYEGWG